MDDWPMWNDGWPDQGMMGWGGGWNWFFSFPGALSLVSLTIIVVVGIALFREWRRGRMGGSDPNEPASGQAKDETGS